MKPSLQLLLNGADITANLSQYLISATVVDVSGNNADTLDVVLTDPDRRIRAPREGQTLTAVGRFGLANRVFGEFTIDQTTFSGDDSGDTIAINAQSLNPRSGAHQRRTKSYSQKDYPTYGDILKELAGRMELKPAISDEISKEKNEFEAQTEESDIEFASRLGTSLDALVSSKKGRLIVAKRGKGEKTSGEPIPQVHVIYGFNVISYQVFSKDKPRYKKVRAKYYDRAKRKNVVVEEKTESKDGIDLDIREVFQSKAEAERAVKSKISEVSREEGDAEFVIHGNVNVIAEGFALVAIRPEIDGLWTIESVTNTFTGSDAFNTTLHCKPPSGGDKKRESGSGDAQKAKQAVSATSPEGNTSEFAPDFSNIGLNEGDGPE
ncbi:hypothetical protein GCM10007094_24040 [Pseudovibrio japonicus]|uniref:Late control protein D n=1 Tax=Pseudovibrio japonicus TaxID=366534 RepID=A0ABQ3EDB4_9HYPH|nr:contractile injection system protein, VgrG/Pvc8 family [Pseudovibrio japonicus]GHB34154.1 hypothetical protein GCM10007094_24040 [Pseudovibrio japonicus]